MRKLFYIAGSVIAMAAAMASCVDVESIVPDVARPVVQAYLMPGHVAEVDVWRESIFVDTDTTIYPEDLQLNIEVNGKSFPLTYTSDSRFVNDDVVIDQTSTYRLKFNYNNQEVSATTDIPSKPVNYTQSDTIIAVPAFGLGVEFPDPIELKWVNDDGSYYIVIVESAEANPTQINQNRGGRPPFAFRNDPTTGSNYNLRAQSFQYYGRHRVILMKVTADYAALYQQNGTSSINIKTPFTNVTNGLGIFTGVNSDTLTVRVKAP